MDNTNKIKDNAEKLLAGVRQTVMVTNLSLAAALETSFQAMYEKEEGILFMGIRTDNTAILIATGEGSNSIIQLNVTGGLATGFRPSIEDEYGYIEESIFDLTNQWTAYKG